MKVILNTNITKSNNSVSKQNNPNFASRYPVFIFPEEERLMPHWDGCVRKFFNRIRDFLNIQTPDAPPNKNYQPTLWREISDFVSSKYLGFPETWTRGKRTLFHQVHAYSDENEKIIAEELKRRNIKFAQVELD